MTFGIGVRHGLKVSINEYYKVQSYLSNFEMGS